MVLGMHRSGTSVVAKALHSLGVVLGDDLLGATQDNPKGYWEHRGIVELNQRILAELGCNWFSLKVLSDDDFLSLPSTYYQEAGRLLQALQAQASEKRAQCMAFKDPRAVVLLPFWRRASQQVGLSPSYIVVHRNPIDVAASISRRDGFSCFYGCLLWVRYYLDVLRYGIDDTVQLVEFNALLNDPESHMMTLAGALGLDVDDAESASLRYRDEFVDKALVTQQGRADIEAVPSIIPQLQTVLTQWGAGQLPQAADVDAITQWFGSSKAFLSYMEGVETALYKTAIVQQQQPLDFMIPSEKSLLDARASTLFKAFHTRYDQLLLAQQKLSNHAVIEELETIKKSRWYAYARRFF